MDAKPAGRQQQHDSNGRNSDSSGAHVTTKQGEELATRGDDALTQAPEDLLPQKQQQQQHASTAQAIGPRHGALSPAVIAVSSSPSSSAAGFESNIANQHHDDDDSHTEGRPSPPHLHHPSLDPPRFTTTTTTASTTTATPATAPTATTTTTTATTITTRPRKASSTSPKSPVAIAVHQQHISPSAPTNRSLSPTRSKKRAIETMLDGDSDEESPQQIKLSPKQHNPQPPPLPKRGSPNALTTETATTATTTAAKQTRPVSPSATKSKSTSPTSPSHPATVGPVAVVPTDSPLYVRGDVHYEAARELLRGYRERGGSVGAPVFDFFDGWVREVEVGAVSVADALFELLLEEYDPATDEALVTRIPMLITQILQRKYATSFLIFPSSSYVSSFQTQHCAFSLVFVRRLTDIGEKRLFRNYFAS